jgi:hypothetical protein
MALRVLGQKILARYDWLYDAHHGNRHEG